ncbi:hypothetical protein SteCoe_24825 [Stentor coeruleus]|uniref:Uncharacterized protein n=1 Tax=Stentor coeruleus TaxID=5963 RepID=A0A1R2BGR7_9CILI|nr:hypothetical protein SteCoe_24825 [Stentor coeruleus]
MIRLIKFLSRMLSELKLQIAHHKLGLAISTSIFLLSVLAYFSRIKSQTLRVSESQSIPESSKPTSYKTDRQRQELWTKEFSIKIITRNSLLELLNSFNLKHKDRMQAIYDQNRIRRRNLRQESKEKYDRFLNTIIEEESQEHKRIFHEYLAEKKITKEEYDKVIEMYKVDEEIIECLNAINSEPFEGNDVDENIVEEILKYELSELKKPQTRISRYLIEDTIWENWQVETGDAHEVARKNKRLNKYFKGVKLLR